MPSSVGKRELLAVCAKPQVLSHARLRFLYSEARDRPISPQWAAEYSQLPCKRLEDLRSGVVILTLLFKIFPRLIERRFRVRWAPKFDHEQALNWDAIEHAVALLRLPADLFDRTGLQACHFRPTYNLLVALYFLHQVAQNNQFTADFSHPIEPALAAYLQSRAAVESMIIGGAITQESCLGDFPTCSTWTATVAAAPPNTASWRHEFPLGQPTRAKPFSSPSSTNCGTADRNVSKDNENIALQLVKMRVEVERLQSALDSSSAELAVVRRIHSLELKCLISILDDQSHGSGKKRDAAETSAAMDQFKRECRQVFAQRLEQVNEQLRKEHALCVDACAISSDCIDSLDAASNAQTQRRAICLEQIVANQAIEIENLRARLTCGMGSETCDLPMRQASSVPESESQVAGERMKELDDTLLKLSGATEHIDDEIVHSSSHGIGNAQQLIRDNADLRRMVKCLYRRHCELMVRQLRSDQDTCVLDQEQQHRRINEGRLDVPQPGRKKPLVQTQYYLGVGDDSDASCTSSDCDTEFDDGTTRSTVKYLPTENGSIGRSNGYANQRTSPTDQTIHSHHLTMCPSERYQAIAAVTASGGSRPPEFRQIHCQVVIDDVAHMIKLEISDDDTPSSLALELLDELGISESTVTTLRDVVHQIEQALATPISVSP